VAFTSAELHLAVGEFDLAREALHSVLRMVRDASDRIGEAHVLDALGVTRQREGRMDNATTTLAHALELAGRVRERMVEAKAHLALGEIVLARGDIAAAAEHLDRAQHLFTELKAPAWQQKTLTLLEQVRKGLGGYTSGVTLTDENLPAA
jgi:tetratricopeptide (TPR) repeat protein